MFRKLLSAVTSTAVVAGLVTAGAVATAAPASAVFNIPPYKDSADNPNLASKCGLDFGLVLDSSGSIGTTGITNLKLAADAFVDSLKDTGSRVAVTSFSSSSPGQGNNPTPTNLAPTDLTSGANLTKIKNSYSGLQSGGSTNWQDGLLKMQNYFPQFTPAGAPDLIVFITDGNPNTINGQNGPVGASPDGSKAAVDPAIDIANAMKAKQTHMFGIAVGGPIQLDPIKAVTSKTEYTSSPSNFGSAGFMQSTSYAALIKDLQKISADLCGSSVTITKQVKNPTTNNSYVPASGWQFDTAVTLPVPGKWITPDTAPPASNNDIPASPTVSTRPVTTDSNGLATFQWQPTGKNNTNSVVVKETVPASSGYERDPMLVCTKSNVNGTTSPSVDVPIDQSTGTWTLPGPMTPGDKYACTATNTLTKLNLAKVVSTGTATAAQFRLKANPIGAPAGTPSYAQDGDYTGFEPIAGDVVYELSETGPANYSQSGLWTCTNGVNVSVVNGKSQITVPKGKQTSCTVTNTRESGTLKLVKDVNKAGGTISADDWKLTATGPTGAPKVENLGGSGTPQPVWSNVTYTLTENPNPGANFTSQGWKCDNGVTVTNNQITTLAGKDVTCTVTNTRESGTLKLVKDVNKAGGTISADDWKLTATGPTGAPKVENLGGSGTPQPVWSNVTYTLTENPNPGANFTSQGWKCDNGVTVTNNQITTLAGKDVTCTVTNTRESGTLKLVKDVNKAGGTISADDWKLTATGPTGAPKVENLGGSGTPQPVWSNVTYTLTENPNPGANFTSQGWKCDNGVTVTNNQITTLAGKDVTCTVTNTRESGTLKLVKDVNKAGGTISADDWKLTATGPTGAPKVENLGGSGTPQPVWSNVTYTLTENPNPGANFTSQGWKCDNGVTVTNNQITTLAGKDVTCTVTNTRESGTLKLVKDVSPSNSGSADDWKLTATGPTGAPKVENLGGSGTPQPVWSNVTYTLTENPNPGANFTSQGWKCDNGVTVTNNQITTLAGKDVTCTVTNTRDTAKISLVKQVEGKGDPADWTLTATPNPIIPGQNAVSGNGDPNSPDAVKEKVVFTGTYKLSEQGPDKYTPGEWVCMSANNRTGTVTAADLQEALNKGDLIKLDKGANIVCTIINTRDLGSLTIVKSFTPKTSDYDKAFNIDYKCGEDPTQTVSLKAGESTTIGGIPTGTECTVSEVTPTDPQAGWSFSEPKYDPADGKVTVNKKGETVTVTVTNEILKAAINIVKTGSPTQVNPGETVTYTYTVTNPGDTELSNVTVTDDKCKTVTYQSGDIDKDGKLQPTETWIFTCSQAITVATTNTAVASGKPKNGPEVTAQATLTVPVVSPVVAKKICPIDVTLHKPQPTKVGNRIMTDKIKTKKSSCVLLKPVVLCRPIAASAAGETAFCDTKVTKKGRVTVKTKGYEAVRVTVLVRTKPKPGFFDQWKPNTWRKSWKLK